MHRMLFIAAGGFALGVAVAAGAQDMPPPPPEPPAAPSAEPAAPAPPADPAPVPPPPPVVDPAPPPPPPAALSPAAASDDYPVCSAAVQDHCVNRAEAPRRHHRRPPR